MENEKANNIKEIAQGLYRLKVTFNVTESIERFVYLYIITGRQTHLIDTGTSGADKQIAEFLTASGKSIFDVRNILITHSHPDHIGSLRKIKDVSGSLVYASEPEKLWIEDIDTQFEERPIPNFYKLLNESTEIDVIVKDKDVLPLEKEVNIQVLDTKGHSKGHVSYYWTEQKMLFTGDSIPVEGQIPIYVSVKDSIESLKKMLELENVDYFLSAWDDVYDSETGKKHIQKAIDNLTELDTTVKTITDNYLVDRKLDESKAEESMDEFERQMLTDYELNEIFERVCEALKMENMLDNPLFRNSIYSNIKDYL
ncbi:Hydroxyacylglutathione hydrolase [Methanosarcinaceae archaeon Ag5]|uniref:Hydroxyacylglutathione hydrolase n=1 Tax=Methanolapillus africanus TaxID=3028297 RepID=A0AAE4SDT5_9EURY|nr:Hydroxyacylglutathione hydrolase [Methanosarcinaceae archaeon Ag5]